MSDDDLDLRADLAVRGVRAAPQVRRTGGAGPSDDGHLRLAGRATTLPIMEDSPFAISDGQVLADDDACGLAAETVARPAFYDLTTDDGLPYWQLARLHGTDVLATTVIQSCVRYAAESTRCRFCAIEAPLHAGLTPRVKRPEQLAQVAAAARRLDGVRHVVMTTGTTSGADRGAAHLAKCVVAVRRAVPDLPVQVQIEPPADLDWLTALHQAGTTSIGIHAESLDEQVRARWTPGKAEVSLGAYEAAWREAVAVFGRNRVSTYLLVGLGEDPDELVAGAGRLIDMGVYPFVVPYRPLGGTLAAADGVPAPAPSLVADVTRRVGALLHAAGMRGADQQAGCAACGACSLLQVAGG